MKVAKIACASVPVFCNQNLGKRNMNLHKESDERKSNLQGQNPCFAQKLYHVSLQCLELFNYT